MCHAIAFKRSKGVAAVLSARGKMDRAGLFGNRRAGDPAALLRNAMQLWRLNRLRSHQIRCEPCEMRGDAHLLLAGVLSRLCSKVSACAS
jgi:hypothetical protein